MRALTLSQAMTFCHTKRDLLIAYQWVCGRKANISQHLPPYENFPRFTFDSI